MCCLHIVVNPRKFFETAILARCLVSHKTGLILHFLHKQCLYQVRNMTDVIHWFEVSELLIFQFDYRLSILKFPRIFCLFYFSTYLSNKIVMYLSIKQNKTQICFCRKWNYKILILNTT